MPIPPALLREMNDCRDRWHQADADRERLVVAAWKAGGGIREIAVEVGMSHVGVSKMLQRLGVREPLTLSGEDAERAAREARGER
jgi:IS30 family transposase